MSYSVMKVSEAKTKMCPFIQIGVQQEDKTVYTGNINCKCNECMAWVYTKENEEEHHPRTGEYQQELEIIKRLEKKGFKSNGKKGIDFRFIRPLPEDKKEGYCKRLEV